MLWLRGTVGFLDHIEIDHVVDTVHKEKMLFFVYKEIPLGASILIVTDVFEVALELRKDLGDVLEWNEDVGIHEHFLRFEAVHEFLPEGAVISAGHGVRRATDVIEA